jgi:DNA-binding response OmpR family regulator
VSRVLVHEARHHPDDFTGVLAGEGHEVVVCTGREALFDQLTERRPDVLVYVLGELVIDVAVLSLLRRVAPRLPIVLLGGPSGLEARRAVQDLKPVYYGVFPLEPAELSQAVRAALAGANGHAGNGHSGHAQLGHAGHGGRPHDAGHAGKGVRP